jgi:hypothetical protein
MVLSIPLLRLFNVLKKAFHLNDEIANEVVTTFDGVLKEQVRVHTGHQNEIIRKDIDSLRGHVDEKFAHMKVYMDEKFRSVSSELLKAISGNNASQLRWIFLFWIGQVGATLGFLYFVIRK